MNNDVFNLQQECAYLQRDLDKMRVQLSVSDGLLDGSQKELKRVNADYANLRRAVTMLADRLVRDGQDDIAAELRGFL